MQVFSEKVTINPWGKNLCNPSVKKVKNFKQHPTITSSAFFFAASNIVISVLDTIFSIGTSFDSLNGVFVDFVPKYKM